MGKHIKDWELTAAIEESGSSADPVVRELTKTKIAIQKQIAVVELALQRRLCYLAKKKDRCRSYLRQV